MTNKMALYDDILKLKPTSAEGLEAKDFKSAAAVRWCAGCGDFSILAQLQKTMSELGVPREKFALISGIGCSSRFPYYMNTYGYHTIHGRAIAMASGLRLARPDLSIWVPIGDGDCLSIGGNHFIHAARRNMNMNVIMFNNEIYSLTKGQQSPTSRVGLKTKSSPLGAIDDPFEPATLAMGSGATFVARGIDTDAASMRELFKASYAHQGFSFTEIYSNCVIFNDGALNDFTNKETRKERTIWLEHGKPLVFGANSDKGIKMDGARPKVISFNDGKHSIDDALVHNNEDSYMAFLLANMSYDPTMPRPMGIFLDLKIDTYIQRSEKQLAMYYNPNADLMTLLKGDESWDVM
jgi:2-oxoglutarate ferredoxin oxidoreductase subunit beta